MQRIWQPPHRFTPTCKAIMTIVRPIITAKQQGGNKGLIASFYVPGRFAVYIEDGSPRGREERGVKGRGERFSISWSAFPRCLARSHFCWFNWREGEEQKEVVVEGILSHFVYLIAVGVFVITVKSKPLWASGGLRAERTWNVEMERILNV